MEDIKEKSADEMFEELGYERTERNDKGEYKIDYYNKKKDKEFTFMYKNCYSIKRPTKDEQSAINKKIEELGW